jgi:DNA invertase Pin-like site-specific DNA recombinase
VVAEFADPALSGASLMRPGLQSLMRGAAEGAFDIALAESLDRFSRDQEDTAGLFKRLQFAGVNVVTVSEHDITHLHIGLKGTMNALYLRDLAERTHRGLRGRIEAGKSGGGRCYGYRVVAGNSEGRGERVIDQAEAAVVRRIFREFNAGISPKRIAKALNNERIPGPRSRDHRRPAAWSPSTIHGHAGRGTGLLNNELYIGRLVWNRQRFVKDPDTGKRLARVNPRAEWIVTEVPHLRIIDEEVWQAAKARQMQTRGKLGTGLVRARRPKYLFSGLTFCETCGGGFTLSSRDVLRCFNATSRGTCPNARSIRRREVEARALRAMRERFFDPGAFAAFCEGFRDEMMRLRRESLAQKADARRDLAAIERRREEILTAVTAGYRSEAWKAELAELDSKQARLTVALAEPPLPALHPRMAEVFQQKAATLAAGLERDEHRDAAREALRGFLDRIVIPPGDGLLRVIGNFGEMLTAAGGRSGAAAVAYVGCGGGI